MSDDAPSWLEKWKGDGVIARIESPQLLDALRKLQLPTIDLRGMHDIPSVPLIETDDRVVTHLAVDHLRERGFEHYAFCGYTGANFSRRRLHYFEQIMRDLGYDWSVFEGPGGGDLTATTAVETHGLLSERQLERWLTSLPKPVAMMACNDVRGQQVITACRDIGIAVPEEISVIGVDNDYLVCELCDPPLSSVEPNTEHIGYAAAALLDRMVAGEPPPQRKMFVPPLGVTPRASTAVWAIKDPHIAAAMRFMRERACDNITVEDVLEHVPVSRSTLERGFVDLVGKTPKAFIRHIQIERVKQLLRETDFPIQKVASIVGFQHVETLCTVFRRHTGQTPGHYRTHNKDITTHAPRRRNASATNLAL
ncbi:MAG: XylR family transcriptional regulator [Phycisphaeraceae bacterium]